MTDQVGEPFGERLARMEESITELHRQQAAAWRRIDDNDKVVSDMKIVHVQSEAKIEADIAHLERDSMKETFSMKTQIAEIGWRVGLVIGAALLILNFVMNKIDVGNFFNRQDPPKQSRR